MGQGFSGCGGCHQRILWARTDNQKSMPLDPQPNPAGNVGVRRDPNSDIWFARVITDAMPRRPGEAVYMAHFGTCNARPKPKTKAVTPGNAKTVARRKPITQPTQMDLGMPLPANVIPMDRSRSS